MDRFTNIVHGYSSVRGDDYEEDADYVLPKPTMDGILKKRDRPVVSEDQAKKDAVWKITVGDGELQGGKSRGGLTQRIRSQCKGYYDFNTKKDIIGEFFTELFGDEKADWGCLVGGLKAMNWNLEAFVFKMVLVAGYNYQSNISGHILAFCRGKK